MKKIKARSIGDIGNYYGGLYVTEHEGRFYWIIENYNTDFDDLTRWQEITRELYNSLIDFDNSELNNLK